MGAARYHLQVRVCCRSGIDAPTLKCSLPPSHCLHKATLIRPEIGTDIDKAPQIKRLLSAFTSSSSAGLFSTLGRRRCLPLSADWTNV